MAPVKHLRSVSLQQRSHKSPLTGSRRWFLYLVIQNPTLPIGRSIDEVSSELIHNITPVTTRVADGPASATHRPGQKWAAADPISDCVSHSNDRAHARAACHVLQRSGRYYYICGRI